MKVVRKRSFGAVPSCCQSVFDGLCPVSPSRGRRHFCAVLFTENTPLDDEPRAALRSFALADRHQQHHRHLVNYAYIFQEKQMHFVNALVGGEELHVHILGDADALC